MKFASRVATLPLRTAPHTGSKDWYEKSVSDGLRILADRAKKEMPEEIELYKALTNAAMLVYKHEEHVNMLRLDTPRDQTVYNDPYFVHKGYDAALEKLLAVVTYKRKLGLDVCIDLEKRLTDILFEVFEEGTAVLQRIKQASQNPRF